MKSVPSHPRNKGLRAAGKLDLISLYRFTTTSAKNQRPEPIGDLAPTPPGVVVIPVQGVEIVPKLGQLPRHLSHDEGSGHVPQGLLLS